MKKTALLAVALATCLGYAPARAADVVSANIVGYNKMHLQPGFNMVGVQFKKVGSAANKIDIQEAIKPEGLVGFDWTMFDGGDTLLIWDPAGQGYNETYIWAGTEDTSGVLGYDISGTWFDPNTFTSVERPLDAGSALWIRSTGFATNTIAGEVPQTNGTFTATIVAEGFSMIANPCPTTLSINSDMTVSGLVGFDWTMFDGGDTLLIWDPAGQGYNETYIWAGTEDTSGVLGYDISGTWFDPNTFQSTDAVVPVGGAIWIRTSGSGGTIQFNNPGN